MTFFYLIIQTLNRHWDDERTYQESRRIIVAQIQHITYNEYVPLLLGKEHSVKYGLGLQSHAYSSDYSLAVDATVLNEFAAAAGLFFYAMYPTSLPQYTKEGGRTLERTLSSYFLDPSTLYFQGRMDGVLR